jgi:hypothetical protein
MSRSANRLSRKLALAQYCSLSWNRTLMRPSALVNDVAPLLTISTSVLAMMPSGLPLESPAMNGGALGDAELLGHRVADLGLEVDLGVLEIPVGDDDARVELVRRDLLQAVGQARGLGARADLAGPRRGEVAGALGLLHARARRAADLHDVADRAETARCP